MSRRRAGRAAALLGLLLAAALGPGGGAAGAGEVVLRNDRVLRGHARRAGGFVEFNPYHCAAPEMTFGVERLPEAEVREIRPWPLGDDLYARRLALTESDLAGRRALLSEALGARESRLAQRLAEEILLLAPGDAPALKAAGGAARFAARREALRYEAPAAKAALGALLGLPSALERREAAARLAREVGAPLPAAWVERLALARRLARGEVGERRLEVTAGAAPEARYWLYVPEDLDPLEPRPLLLALHGGGMRAGPEGGVRGSGRDALAWFLEGARAHGFLLACPDALEAPWAGPKNQALIEAVRAEVCALYPVDLERVHVAGEGGGGDGAWWFAGRDPRALATVGVASGARPERLGALVAAEVGIWFFHGEEDETVPVAEARRAAEVLRKRAADFVYCELPRERGGFPPAARRDYWRYVFPKRRARAESAWPRSSLTEPPAKAYLAALGDPAAAWGLGLGPDLAPADLLARLARGGFEAEPAARRLGAARPPDAETLTAVRDLVRRAQTPVEARRWGAWLLGAWKDPEAVAVLGDLLRAERNPELIYAAAEAVAVLGHPDSREDLVRALTDLGARHKAVPGQGLALWALESACRLGAALAHALARVGAGPDTAALATLEEALVIGVLRDPRPVAADAAAQARGLKAGLAGALARTYRALRAPATLVDMLRVVTRREPLAAAAVETGLREGWR